MLRLQVQDDLVDNPFNPYPGKIFNRPGGKNVAAGVKPVRVNSQALRGQTGCSCVQACLTL